MSNLQLLTKVQQENFDNCPTFSKSQQERYFEMDLETKKFVDNLRDKSNQAVFLIQLAYFRASGKFFPNNCFKISDVEYVCELIGVLVT